MAYLIEFSARAAHDLEVLYVEKNAAESVAAARWYNGLEEALDDFNGIRTAALLLLKLES